jgi:hypothetical protein
LPFTENGRIHVFGLELPLEPDTTFLASVHWAGELKLRVEEIAASENVAESQAGSLALLLTLARGAVTGLDANPLNDSLKQVLRTAKISQRNNRVLIDATLPRNLPAELTSGPEGDSASRNALK